MGITLGRLTVLEVLADGDEGADYAWVEAGLIFAEDNPVYMKHAMLAINLGVRM